MKVEQMDMFGAHRVIRTRRAFPRLPSVLRPSGSVGSLLARFRSFHAANPEVYVAICDIARDMKELGFETAGIGLIFERLRWLSAIRTRGDDFKLNNSYRAFYARLIMESAPDLVGFFRLREQRAPRVAESDTREN